MTVIIFTSSVKPLCFKVISGDDDLPKRDDIGERRRKHELRVLARAGANPMDDDDMADEDGGIEENPMDIDASEDGDAIGSEDEFYKEVKKWRAEKLKAKAELYSRHVSILENLKLYGSSLFCCMVSCVMKAVLMSYCIICHRTPAIPLSEEPEADGKRQITYQVGATSFSLGRTL